VYNNENTLIIQLRVPAFELSGGLGLLIFTKILGTLIY